MGYLITHRRAVRGDVPPPDPAPAPPAARAEPDAGDPRAGDEVLTAGGIHGTVPAIEDEIVLLEIAPGTIVRLDRRAVAGGAEESEPEGETEAESPVSTGES